MLGAAIGSLAYKERLTRGDLRADSAYDDARLAVGWRREPGDGSIRAIARSATPHGAPLFGSRKQRHRSEEHTSELQSRI